MKKDLNRIKRYLDAIEHGTVVKYHDLMDCYKGIHSWEWFYKKYTNKSLLKK